ncbi:MAG: phosphoribosyltransferase [Myxococcaceae bacterium]
MVFADRVDAGRRLAKLLEKYRAESPVVLGLPRGGVPVAFEVARELSAPMDVCVVRKIGAPDQPELGLGAVGEGGVLILDHELMRLVGATNEEVGEIAERKAQEVEQRLVLFRAGRPPVELRDRTVLLVDDGIATGGSMRAAIKSVRSRGPGKLIMAIPIASSQALESLSSEVDEVVCLEATPFLGAIGFFYEDFTQVTDREVVQLLERSRAWLERGAPQAAGPPP